MLRQGNLIYMALITNRIPVLPPFEPSLHTGLDLPSIPFSEVFDIERLSKAIDTPVLQWRDIKTWDNVSDDVLEPLGCWSVWETMGQSNTPRNSSNTHTLRIGELKFKLIRFYVERIRALDPSYTKGNNTGNFYKSNTH
jgi:hypothetical protein